ncbi:MAG TPA: ABC-F family ATP-binding cassette domain-containing protein, partial [Spirochaetota bacterium]|nr:ABC-F family ATP-binding cassette domain-containing protein [Spirochaetota bacterium]
NKLCRISFLEQRVDPDPEDTIIGHVLQGSSPRATALRECELCAEKASSGDRDAAEQLALLAEQVDSLGAWDYERRVHTVLAGFGISDLSMKMGHLSGGMAKKVALAQALIEEANCLFLDEPTNHLDVDSIVWLEEYLSRYTGAVIMVTHDRYFLDNVCSTIYEIDCRKFYRYEGNYSYYLEKRDERIASAQKADDRVANILRTELEWLRCGPKARGTKAKARKDRIYELMGHENWKDADEIEIAVTGKRLGKKILEVNDITKKYGERTIIDSFSHIFKNGERVGIAGANGSGKSTLLNLLTGRIAPDSGDVDAGVHTAFGFFTQQSETPDPEEKVIDFVEKSGKTVSMADGSYITASKILEMFLFPSGLHHTPVSKLSGGERRRLFLLQVLMGNPNFLVLDEPTNDLDVRTLSILEDFLQKFAGCLIVVSHDRYFMDRVTDYIFFLDGSSKVKSFPGSFSEYIEYKREEAAAEKAPKETKHDAREDKRATKEKTKLSFNEEREYKTIESDIKKLEEEKESLLAKIAGGSSDPALYAEWGTRLAELDTLIDEKYARWEYLERYASK